MQKKKNDTQRARMSTPPELNVRLTTTPTSYSGTLKFHGAQLISSLVTAHLSIGVNGYGGLTCSCIHDGQG